MDRPKITLRQMFFSLEGRINRSTFWLWGTLPILLFTLLGTVIGLILWWITGDPAFVLVLYIVFSFMAMVPGIAVHVKRCHDRNRIGLFVLLALIPIVWLSVLGMNLYFIGILFDVNALKLLPYLGAPSYIFLIWYWVEIGFLPGTRGENRFSPNSDNGSLLVAVEAVILIMLATFSAISIFQNVGKRMKLDFTGPRVFSLSPGTKAILSKLNQPITAKFYYSRTTATEAPDQIRIFNNYSDLVETLLKEYVAVSKGKFQLEVIDPTPLSDEEKEAIRFGVQRFPIKKGIGFFFGLVIQTEFGVQKVIPFFSPERRGFIEYDISYLIDTAITRQKNTVGILSSLPVMGEDVSGYMREMMMRQGQQPRPPWTFVEQLRRQYEVERVPADTNDIDDIDILMVIHPKGLSEQTLFAIDQYVLKGGRTIVCVDPHCFSDQAPQAMGMQMRMQHDSSSDLNKLLRTWGLEMPPNTFAGDRNLALEASMRRNQEPQSMIGFLGLTPKDSCFDQGSVVTAQLNQVRFLFPGVLNEVEVSSDANDVSPVIERTPLVTTSSEGKAFKLDGTFELMFLDGPRLMDTFDKSKEPEQTLPMSYLVTGRFKSSFPDGIEVKSESPDPNDPNETVTTTARITGLPKAEEDCRVVVFSDVDFISDMIAYENSMFGIGKRAVADNSTLMLNTIEDLSGSSDLAKIRSRGNISRPFLVVEKIKRQAEAETAEEMQKFKNQIKIYQDELNKIASSKEDQERIIGNSILNKMKELELSRDQAQIELDKVELKKDSRINELGRVLKYVNMGFAPAIVLCIALGLAIFRSARRRQYISHASDA